jgi:hypothetical protein
VPAARRDELRSLAANLARGLRWTLPGGEARPFYFSPHQLALLLGVALAVELLASFIAIGPGAEFNSWGLGGFALRMGIVLALLYLLAVLTQRGERLGELLVAQLSVLIPLGALFSLIAAFAAIDTVQAGWFVFALLTTWILLVTTRVMARVLDLGGIRAGLLALVYVGASLFASESLPEAPLWYAGDYDYGYGEQGEALNVEDIYYAQPALMREALAALEPQRPGVVDLYFIGFAAYADEKVFLREARYVRALFDRRFDTAGRSMVLINHPSTADTEPLASTHNLRRALAAVAERMDPEEDLLFLFLTSHGLPDRLAVDHDPLALNDLDDAELAQMLAEADIRWPVVVVSACYSGSFIDALASPRSLVITAAHPERSSFGCGPTSEFTDFGIAYFQQALAETRSFSAAFRHAQVLIAARETAEERNPSQPRMHLGTQMAERLRLLETRLETATVPAGAQE